MASKYEDEGRSPDDGAEPYDRLPFRETGSGRPAPMTPIEARAEVRDRETYYAELRFAVHCQSRSNPSSPSFPAPRAALDDTGMEGESWDDMIARFGDTWT